MGPRSEGRPAANGHASGAVVPAKVRAPRVCWLPGERLDKLLPELWVHRLALVVAPAGSGKTTLLAGWAAMADHPVAWYRAESTDGSEAGLVACLEAAFAVDGRRPAARVDERRGRRGRARVGRFEEDLADRGRPPHVDGIARGGRLRTLHRLRAAGAGGPRRLADGASLQPFAPPRLRGVAGDRCGRPAPPLQPVFTDANGGFTAQVLVLPRDREGPRTLNAVATLSGVPAAPATAPFLVVTGTAAPPVSGLIQVFRDSFGRLIILRR